MIKWIQASLVLFTLVVCVNAEERQTVPIGIIAPLTGNATHIGTEITRTVEVMREMLAADNKYTYSFLMEDGKAATDSSPTTSFSYLTNVKGVRFLISATSGETLQIGPLAQKKGVLTIAVISSHKDVKKIGDYVFRTFIDVERGMKVLAKQVRQDGNTPIALLTEDHAFTQGIKELLTDYLKDEFIYMEDYEESSVDLKPVLLKAKSYGAKGFYFNCSHPRTCAIVVNQARQLGIPGTFYSYLHIDNPEFLEATGTNSNGVKYLSPPDIHASPKHFQEFIQRYRKKYSEELKNEFLVRTTFDALNCIMDGIEEVGPDPMKVKTVLQSYEKPGALGLVKFDQNGDIENIDYVMKEIAGGKPRGVS